MSQLSETIKNLRLMRGFSIRYVAEHLNYAPNTIANWEKGKSSPPADVLILMTDLFDVGPEQLFGSKPCPELDEFLNKKKPIMDEIEMLQKQKKDIEKRLRECTKLLNQGD